MLDQDDQKHILEYIQEHTPEGTKITIVISEPGEQIRSFSNQEHPDMAKAMPFLIWSEEHGQWWSSRAGYTHFSEDAARFSKVEADEIVDEANRFIHPETGFKADRKFNEVVVPDPLWP